MQVLGGFILEEALLTTAHPCSPSALRRLVADMQADQTNAILEIGRVSLGNEKYHYLGVAGLHAQSALSKDHANEFLADTSQELRLKLVGDDGAWDNVIDVCPSRMDAGLDV